MGNDKVGTLDVVAHAVSWLQSKGYKPLEVCCIYPTAPLLQKKDLINSLKDLRSKKWEYIFSATTFGPSIYRSFTKNKKEKLKVVFSDEYIKHPKGISKERLIRLADIIIIATPHKAYYKIKFPKTL